MSVVKERLRSIRRRLADRSGNRRLEHLHVLRDAELETVAPHLVARRRLLDLGAGAGWQARRLQRLGFQVTALDLPTSNYRDVVEFPIVHYDGIAVPFRDASFDIVFSSAMLYIPEPVAWMALQREILRVLAPGGIAVHGLPTAAWRIWTNLTVLATVMRPPERIGVRSNGAWGEVIAFRDDAWKQMFQEAGWRIRTVVANRILYTGASMLGPRLSVPARRRLSRILGSSMNYFVLERPDTDRFAGGVR
jgi:SAM-dependent methyltransferase